MQSRTINGEDLNLRTGWYITTVKSDGVPIGEFWELGAEKEIYFKTGKAYDFYISDEDNSFKDIKIMDISNGLLPLPSDVTEKM